MLADAARRRVQCRCLPARRRVRVEVAPEAQRAPVRIDLDEVTGRHRVDGLERSAGAHEVDEIDGRYYGPWCVAGEAELVDPQRIWCEAQRVPWRWEGK